MHENQFNYQTLMTLTARRLILIIINWDEKFVFYFQFCFLVQHNNVAISSTIFNHILWRTYPIKAQTYVLQCTLLEFIVTFIAS